MQKPLYLLTGFLLVAATLWSQVPDISVLQRRAPEIFRASFKTTRGEFIIEANRKWSPAGVDRLYQLILTGFYNNNIVFRAEPEYVVQFGIGANEKLNRFWDPKKLQDEPVQTLHRKGIIAFARDGANDRSTQLFIDMVDNHKLDTISRKGVRGFTPVAKVVRGMNVLALFNARYGRQPGNIQDSLYKYGNAYFEKYFPGLDKIISATIVH